MQDANTTVLSGTAPLRDRASQSVRDASARSGNVPQRARAARRRRRPRQQSDRRHGTERRHPGRRQPGWKVGEVILDGGSDRLLDLYDRQRRTVAIEFVQEQSIANKKRLEESDPRTRQKNLDELSRIAEDPERARQFLLRTAMILSQRRADVDVLNERSPPLNGFNGDNAAAGEQFSVALTKSQNLKSKWKSADWKSGIDTAGIPNRLAGIANGIARRGQSDRRWAGRRQRDARVTRRMPILSKYPAMAALIQQSLVILEGHRLRLI